MTKARKFQAKIKEPVKPPTPQPSEPQKVEDERYGIYSLRYPTTLKVFYVGQAKDPYKRFMQHLQMDGTNREKDAIIAELKDKGVSPVMQVETWCYGKEASDTSEASFIEYYRAWGHPISNIMLHLCSSAEVGRSVAEHERALTKRYASLSWFQRFLMPIRPFFMLNKQDREEYRWQMEEDRIILSALKAQMKVGA